MARPHGILRAGFPYLTTLGMRRVTNFPTDVAFGEDNKLFILMRSEGAATIRIWSCLLYTSPSPRDGLLSRMPSSA